MRPEVLFIAVFFLAFLSASLGFGLGYAAKFFKVEQNPIVETILEMMPGSNCGQCGHPGCAAAAQAIVDGVAPLTCCPPGGHVLAEELAETLGVTLDASSLTPKVPMLAQVNEQLCIGCARCVKKCPTDAIIGAQKQIHAVIQDACTGCEACVAICPTGCLQMHPVRTTLKTWRWDKPEPILAAAA